MKRHWSFVVTDKKYLYPASLFLIAAGLCAAYIFHEPTHVNRAGNFIIGIGVWMSMRYTLREGINRSKDFSDRSPTIPGTKQMNSAFFNQIAFSIGDAHLQIHGFVLVIAGSFVGSFGDILLEALFPSAFNL